MIVDKINNYLSAKEKTLDESLRYEVEKMAGWVFKRQFMTEDSDVSKGTVRLSSAGRCPRQVAYAFHGFEKKGKEIDARAKLVFWTGDLVELTVINLAKLAGANITATGLQQMSIKLPVNGAMVSGHPDGLLFEDKTAYLIEVKSMASYSFERFLKGVIDESYLIQVNSYMEALGLFKCCFVALNKDSGVMHEIVFDKDPAIVEKARANIMSVLHSTPENLPEAPYKADESGIYPWQCLYCAYWGLCRPNAEKVLVKNSYKLKEKANGNSVRREDAPSGDGNREVGTGVREVPAPVGKLGRVKKDNPVRGNAETPRRSAMESGSKGANVGGVQASS